MKKNFDLIFLIDDSLRDLNNEELFSKTMIEYETFKLNNPEFIIIYDDKKNKSKNRKFFLTLLNKQIAEKFRTEIIDELIKRDVNLFVQDVLGGNHFSPNDLRHLLHEGIRGYTNWSSLELISEFIERDR